MCSYEFWKTVKRLWRPKHNPHRNDACRAAHDPNGCWFLPSGWMALTFLGALAGGVGVQLNIALGKARHHRRTRSETLRVGGPRCVLGDVLFVAFSSRLNSCASILPSPDVSTCP